MAEREIIVRLVRSSIGRPPVQRATVRALGLRKVNSAVTHTATSAVLGMVKKVSHLIRVEETNA